MPRSRSEKRPAPRESIATENYLKQILSLSHRGDDGAARTRGPRDKRDKGGATDKRVQRVLMSDVAAALDLTRGTVTTQVKRLAREGLVRYERYGGVELTARGEQIALGVLHRHRLVETFLVRTLGLDWAEVHEEAERLEHVLSDRVLQALDRWLGRPAVDPHGDPIPRPARMRSRAVMRTQSPSRERSLAACSAGQRVTVKRLLEQSGAFLRFASKHGVTPGAMLEVLAPTPKRTSMRVRTQGGRIVSIDHEKAERVLVATVRGTSQRGPSQRGTSRSAPPR